MDFDIRVKLALYRAVVETTRIPSAPELARTLGETADDVRAAYGSLHRMKLLVPEPGDPDRVRMAPPFSGVPTAFRVSAGGKEYFANCVWDALGIPAALHLEAAVDAVDGQTGRPLPIKIGAHGPEPRPSVVHFAVPAAHWWDDVIYT